MEEVLLSELMRYSAHEVELASLRKRSYVLLAITIAFSIGSAITTFGKKQRKA